MLILIDLMDNTLYKMIKATISVICMLFLSEINSSNESKDKREQLGLYCIIRYSYYPYHGSVI